MKYRKIIMEHINVLFKMFLYLGKNVSVPVTTSEEEVFFRWMQKRQEVVLALMVLCKKGIHTISLFVTQICIDSLLCWKREGVLRNWLKKNK